eukprot:1158703-Alexandrium_andersonii.AAC.1
MMGTVSPAMERSCTSSCSENSLYRPLLSPWEGEALPLRSALLHAEHRKVARFCFRGRGR